MCRQTLLFVWVVLASVPSMVATIAWGLLVSTVIDMVRQSKDGLMAGTIVGLAWSLVWITLESFIPRNAVCSMYVAAQAYLLGCVFASAVRIHLARHLAILSVAPIISLNGAIYIGLMAGQGFALTTTTARPIDTSAPWKDWCSPSDQFPLYALVITAAGLGLASALRPAEPKVRKPNPVQGAPPVVQPMSQRFSVGLYDSDDEEEVSLHRAQHLSSKH